MIPLAHESMVLLPHSKACSVEALRWIDRRMTASFWSQVRLASGQCHAYAYNALSRTTEMITVQLYPQTIPQTRGVL